MHKSLIISSLCILIFTGCFRQEVRTIVVEVPQMHSAACGQVIQDALVRGDGILSAHPDLLAKTISVTYESTKIAAKNVESIIADVGFRANDRPPDETVRATLAAECQ